MAMINKTVLVVFLVVLTCASTVGCGSTVRLTKKSRSHLRTVSVESVDLEDDRIQYMGPALNGYDPISPSFYVLPIVRELAILYCITPVGLWHVSAAYDEMEEALTRRYQRSGIDVKNMVRRRFTNQVRQTDLFTVVSSSDADGHVALHIEAGLTPSNGWFGHGVQPWIVVEAVMKDGDERVIWRKEADVSTFAREIPSHDANLYFRKPELFRKSIGTAVRLAVEELVEHLEQG